MGEDIEIKREIVLEADAETLGKMRKEGHARGNGRVFDPEELRKKK